MRRLTDKPMGALKPGSRTQPDSGPRPAPQLAVDLAHHSPEWVDEVEDGFLVRAANEAYRAGAGSTPPAELSLLLTSDEEIRDLNKTWRGRDEATNVLSFPLDTPSCEQGPRPVGDVVLAFETVAREAGERAIPVSQHAAHLVVHGVLHLLGYDHENDSQAYSMETLEVQVLNALGIPDPYGLEAMTSGERQ